MLKKALYILIVIIGAAAGGAGMYMVSRYTDILTAKKGLEQGEDNTGKPAKSPDKKGKKILYWRAPMDPTYISDKPGKSPMGMDLIPVYEGEEDTAEPGTVRIDPVTMQNIGVRTAKVERRPLEKIIRTVGRVAYDEKRLYHVHTKIEGWVEKLYVDFTGQKVEKGDILLEIYSPELVSTQEEYLLARRYSKLFEEKGSPADTQSILELSRRRLELWDVPAHQIEELDRTGKIMKTLHIHSPSRGIVIEKNVVEGMFVKPGMSLYKIADISKVWVYVDVYEYETPWIKVGQEAEMTLASYPGRVFRGKVSFIYPFMEPETRTNKVRLEFDNPDFELKPDMYANVILKSRIAGDSLAVPKEAVLLSGERAIVILARGGGKFMPKEVRLGAEADDYYQVLDGLKEGDEVVVSAHFLIDSESKLKEAITKMLEAKKGKKGGNGMEGMKGMKDMKDMKGADNPKKETVK